MTVGDPTVGDVTDRTGIPGKTGAVLRRVSLWNHLLVGLSILVMTLLAGFRDICAGD